MAESFVRSIMPLKTYHLDAHVCDTLHESDPLLAEVLRQAIAACILRQVQDPDLRQLASQRSEELLGDDERGRNERLQIEESMPQWVRMSTEQRELSESTATGLLSLQRSRGSRDSDAVVDAVLGPQSPPPPGSTDSRRGLLGEDKDQNSASGESESEKPNPQDPEFEDARPPPGPLALPLPGVPGDVSPTAQPRDPTR